MDTVICAACGEPITGRDYEERIWGHEEGCLANTALDEWVECDCDLEYHPACYVRDDEDEHPVDCTCEECAEVLRSAGYELIADEVLYSAEYDWSDDDDEDTGLHQCLCEDNVGRLGKCEYCGGQIIPF